MNDNRLLIFVLHKTSGIFNEFIDIQSALGFLQRTGRLHLWRIIATKGPKAAHFDKIDAVTIERDLGDFQNKP